MSLFEQKLRFLHSKGIMFAYDKPFDYNGNKCVIRHTEKLNDCKLEVYNKAKSKFIENKFQDIFI